MRGSEPDDLTSPPPAAAFIDALGAEEARALRERGVVKHYPRGTPLFHERQVPDSVMLLEGGQVKLSSITPDGKEIVLAIRSRGDLVGEQSTLDGKPRSATATALEGVDALVVPASEFRGFLNRHPRAALALLEMLSSRLRDADHKRLEYVAYDTVGRVAARLLELAERFGRKDAGVVHIDLAISQEELAGWTGASVESVGKALHALRAPGWIETGRRRLTILDIDALRRLAA